MTHPGDPAADWLWTPRHSPWRWLLATAAAVAALAHVPVIGPHLAQAPYMGVEFIVLTGAFLLLALAALICDTAAVYSLGLATGGLAIIGYVATRLVAFPQLADDVGDWFEPLGVLCVLAESVAMIAAIGGLLGVRQRPRLGHWRKGATVSRMPERRGLVRPYAVSGPSTAGGRPTCRFGLAR